MRSILRKDQWLKMPRLDFLRLRPYGQSLATPAVRVWLGFAWVVILLMASIEGIVWGLVSASIVPDAITWLQPIAGLFMFILMFSVIWIVDASLIMSERPTLRARRWNPFINQGFGAIVRWFFGLLLRVAIVAISLYVTAPFLGKLIRADDISSYHQRQVEQYYAQRDATLQTHIRDRAAQIETLYRERTQPLEADIARINQALALERDRRLQMETEYAPELAILRQDLVAARERLGNEVMGRKGRPEGRGPEARKWELNAKQIADVLAAKQAEVDNRLSAVITQIKALEEALTAASERLNQLRQEQQTRLDQATAELTAQQVEAVPPRLTFAARSKILHALRQSPDENGVPHFETVEGFSQAALGVLFFALIALKLFEPAAVSAYFSETMQLQYRKYLVGGLAEIPGFETWQDSDQQLNPLEFVRLWQLYEKDPAAFYAARQAFLEVREPLLNYQAGQSFEQELLQLRQENLQQEHEFVNRRRDLELAAYDQELSLRTAQLKAQLDEETRAQLDQRRVELASELHKARADWARQRAIEEENLRQQREAFEQAQEVARNELRTRLHDIERLREQTLTDVQQTEMERRHSHLRQMTEQAAARRREAFQIRLTGIRFELNRLRGVDAKQSADLRNLRQSGRKLEEEMATVRQHLDTAEAAQTARNFELDLLTRRLAAATKAAAATPTRVSFWFGRRAGDSQTVNELKRELKALQKLAQTENERLVRGRDELRRLEVRKLTHDSSVAEITARLDATQHRMLFYEESLGRLLCAQAETNFETEPEVMAMLEADPDANAAETQSATAS